MLNRTIRCESALKPKLGIRTVVRERVSQEARVRGFTIRYVRGSEPRIGLVRGCTAIFNIDALGEWTAHYARHVEGHTAQDEVLRVPRIGFRGRFGVPLKPQKMDSQTYEDIYRAEIEAWSIALRRVRATYRLSPLDKQKFAKLAYADLNLYLRHRARQDWAERKITTILSKAGVPTDIIENFLSRESHVLSGSGKALLSYLEVFNNRKGGIAKLERQLQYMLHPDTPAERRAQLKKDIKHAPACLPLEPPFQSPPRPDVERRRFYGPSGNLEFQII